MGIQLTYQPSALQVGAASFDIGLAEALRQKQAEDFARQQRDAALAEERRQFDITNQRQYDQFAESQYQFDAGQALQDQRLAEGQRQFDAEQALREQQLGDARKSEEFNRQIADHRDRLARYGIMQQSADRQAAVAGQLAEVDLRGQYALAADQNDLLREGMRQQGETQRASDATQGRFGMQWQAQAAKQMQADWQNIQKVLPRLDPSEREELIAQFQHKWESANIPMPVELPQPEIPDWQNPDKMLEMARQIDPEAPWQINSKGELQLPRGYNRANTKKGMEEKHAHELEKAQIASQQKAAEAENKRKESQAKVQETYEMSQLKAMDAELKATQQQDEHQLKMWQQNQRNMQDAKWKEHQALMPKEGMFKKADAEGKAVTDFEAFNRAMTDWATEAKKIYTPIPDTMPGPGGLDEAAAWASGGTPVPTAPPATTAKPTVKPSVVTPVTTTLLGGGEDMDRVAALLPDQPARPATGGEDMDRVAGLLPTMLPDGPTAEAEFRAGRIKPGQPVNIRGKVFVFDAAGNAKRVG